MSLCVYGLNHISAPLNVRERVHFDVQKQLVAFKEIVKPPLLSEMVILSTCNRTEFYISGNEIYPVYDWLEKNLNISYKTLLPHAYEHLNMDAAKHIMQVATGLNSMVLGEPQILGQMKTAYQLAFEQKVVGKILNRLFQRTFHVAKEIRSSTAIGKHPVSIAFASVKLAKHIFPDLKNVNVLLVGRGEMIALSAMHYKSHGVKSITIANRTPELAKTIAQQCNAQLISLSEMNTALPKADIVVSCTASTLPIIGKGAVERAISLRKHKPIFMVDLAVPRDIEPQVQQLEDVYLYNIDHLKDVIKHNYESRRSACAEAEQIIECEAKQYINWLTNKDKLQEVAHFRQDMHSQKDIELERAKQLLENGHKVDDVLESLAHRLTNKILHTPTVRFKQTILEKAASDPNQATPLREKQQ